MISWNYKYKLKRSVCKTRTWKYVLKSGGVGHRNCRDFRRFVITERDCLPRIFVKIIHKVNVIPESN